MAMLMLVVWCFGVGYITFGDTSPGTNIGNLYFSTWASFCISVMLSASAYGTCRNKESTEDKPVADKADSAAAPVSDAAAEENLEELVEESV
jgi:hypothetical protein